MNRFWRVLASAWGAIFVSFAFGFVLIGGLWARIAVDEARIEHAERALVESKFAVNACRANVVAAQDSLSALRRRIRKWSVR